MQNSERALVRIVKQVCNKHLINLQCMSGDWILRLEKDQRIRFIYGYKFDLNGAACLLVADDKCATYDVLSLVGIPAVPHHLFLKPELFSYIGAKGNWEKVLELVEQWGFPIVCKSNLGTGGKQVYFVNNQQELEQSFQELFVNNRGVAIAPYLSIKDELRFVLLQGETLIAYRKIRPDLIGDGRSSFLELLDQLLKERKARLKPSDLYQSPYFFDKVLADGEVFPLHQLHNLGKGAIPERIEHPEAEDLAKRAAAAIGLQFGSVDIVIDQTGKLAVLEINSGVMMEALSVRLDAGGDLAFEVYEKATLAMFPDATVD